MNNQTLTAELEAVESLFAMRLGVTMECGDVRLVRPNDGRYVVQELRHRHNGTAQYQHLQTHTDIAAPSSHFALPWWGRVSRITQKMNNTYIKRHIITRNRRRWQTLYRNRTRLRLNLCHYTIDRDTWLARHGQPLSPTRSERALSAREQSTHERTGISRQIIRYIWSAPPLPANHMVGYKTLEEAIAAMNKPS